MPLSISVTPGSSTSLHQQIIDQIVAGVVAGKLAEDEMVPSVRGLAETLGIHHNTVVKAYGELVQRGILESRAGRGMFVAPRRPMYMRSERLRRVDPLLDAAVKEALLLGFSREEILERVEDRIDALQPKSKDKSPRR